MISMKIKEFSLAMHHGKFEIERFSTEFQSIIDVKQVTMVTEKRISRMKKTFFIENVKHMFVLSILQTVSGKNTPIKSYCTF